MEDSSGTTNMVLDMEPKCIVLICVKTPAFSAEFPLLIKTPVADLKDEPTG